jgi:hypothetical protein
MMRERGREPRAAALHAVHALLLPNWNTGTALKNKGSKAITRLNIAAFLLIFDENCVKEVQSCENGQEARSGGR